MDIGQQIDGDAKDIDPLRERFQSHFNWNLHAEPRAPAD